MSPPDPPPEACPLPRGRRWRRQDTVEAAAIGVALLAALLASGDLRLEVPLGRALAAAGAVLLAQGLARDLARLATRDASAPRRRMRCLCMESAVGPALVAGGLLLLLGGVEAPLALDRLRLTGALAGLLAFGFVAKDWVIVLQRVEDHGAIDVA